MSLPELALESLYERDIDLLLLEELSASSRFRSWWIQQAHVPGTSPWELIGVWHSRCHSTLGESDLVLLLRGSDRHAVLIENKIAAPPQTLQAERYRLRGEAGIQDSEWEAFTTCIVAPRRYLETRHREASFDAAIAYEDVEAWFRSDAQPSARSEYKARLLRQAIDEQRRGYSPKEHPGITVLWRSYWLTASSEFPELGMSEPGPKPAASDWIQFRPPTIGPGRRIVHKLSRGFVDLQLDGAGQDLELMGKRYGHLLAEDLRLEATGKSVSFRKLVPVISLLTEPDSQVDNMRAGMRAALQLIMLSRLIEPP